MAIKHFSLRRVSGPTTEPVTIWEAEAHLRETSTGQRAVITDLIAAAREAGEDECGRAFFTQTWDLKLDEFPDGDDAIEVPRPPLQSVTYIKYITSSGATASMSATDYRVDTSSEPGRITPAYETDWPETRDVTGAVTVRFVAGATTATNISTRVKQAVLLTVGRSYESRGDDDGEPLPAGAVRVYRSLNMRGLA